MSHDASWGIAAKLGTRAIQRCWHHRRAMYGCWIMHEKPLIGLPWLAVVIICQSPALAVQRSQRSFRCCSATLCSCSARRRPAVRRARELARGQRSIVKTPCDLRLPRRFCTLFPWALSFDAVSTKFGVPDLFALSSFGTSCARER